MSGPRRTKSETVPVETEVGRVKTATEARGPVRQTRAAPSNANVVPARRGNSAHSIVPPPTAHADGDPEEVVIEISGDDDESEPPPRRARSDTLSDPTMTQRLAETARGAPAPPGGPNRHVKRRG